MKTLQPLMVLMLVLFVAPLARAAADFSREVNIAPLRTLAVQHMETMKTFDSFSRQVLYGVTGKGSIDGHDAIFTVLDMAFLPENYVDRNLIKIQNVPLREDLVDLDGLKPEEKSRIIKEGTVSLSFWFRPDVQERVKRIESEDVRKAEALQQFAGAAATMAALCGPGAPLPPAAVIPPQSRSGGADGAVWHTLVEVSGGTPWADIMKEGGATPPAPAAGYDENQIDDVMQHAMTLMKSWRMGDAATVNREITSLAAALPAINPAVYPSAAKRRVEVLYNRLAKLTIPGAALYFAAFVCFLMSAYSGVGPLRLWGLRLMAVAFLVHTAGIAIRWWLVGDVFPPIKNEFESVMFSAWFGAAIGLGLELWRSRGIFGAAASFVGWMALIALFAVPFVVHREIGGEIGQVSGVLMSYWLYIHVTLVTASYALIGMGFMLSTWWLVRYYTSGAPASSRLLAPHDATAVPLTFAETIAMLFIPRVRAAREISRGAAPLPRGASAHSLLISLDRCNLVVLQLAFWVLGAGIVCGAIWADQSWGRPWGWDPKETFALITWIVYLIVVHVRVATDHKAWWTSVLAVVGFFVMLFNWIGVNFFLVGLHSYA